MLFKLIQAQSTESILGSTCQYDWWGFACHLCLLPSTQYFRLVIWDIWIHTWSQCSFIHEKIESGFAFYEKVMIFWQTRIDTQVFHFVKKRVFCNRQYKAVNERFIPRDTKFNSSIGGKQVSRKLTWKRISTISLLAWRHLSDHCLWRQSNQGTLVWPAEGSNIYWEWENKSLFLALNKSLEAWLEIVQQSAQNASPWITATIPFQSKKQKEDSPVECIPQRTGKWKILTSLEK